MLVGFFILFHTFSTRKLFPHHQQIDLPRLHPIWFLCWKTLRCGSLNPVARCRRGCSWSHFLKVLKCWLLIHFKFPQSRGRICSNILVINLSSFHCISYWPFRLFFDLGIIQMSRQGLQCWLTQSPPPHPFGWRCKRRRFETGLCGSHEILNGLPDVCTYVLAKTLGDHLNNSIQSCPFGNDFSWARPLKLIWIGRDQLAVLWEFLPRGSMLSRWKPQSLMLKNAKALSCLPPCKIRLVSVSFLVGGGEFRQYYTYFNFIPCFVLFGKWVRISINPQQASFSTPRWLSPSWRANPKWCWRSPTTSRRPTNQWMEGAHCIKQWLWSQHRASTRKFHLI